MKLFFAAALLLSSIGAVQPAAADDEFYAGECVLINTYLEIVIGPDPAIPGNWLAQDMHRGYAGTISSWLPRQMHPTECVETGVN